jgi:hypothetical protein
VLDIIVLTLALARHGSGTVCNNWKVTVLVSAVSYEPNQDMQSQLRFKTVSKYSFFGLKTES